MTDSLFEIAIAGATPATSATFAPDTANTNASDDTDGEG